MAVPTPGSLTWPGAYDNADTLFGDPVNLVEFTLNGGIGSGDTSFAVLDPNSYISSMEVPGFLRFATGEIVYFTAMSTASFDTVERGVGGTSAASHLDGEVIRFIPVAEYFIQYKAAIMALQVELGLDPAGSLSTLVARLAVALDDDGTLKLSAIAEHTGISDDNIVEIDGTASDDQLARFTTNGIDGLSLANLIVALRGAGLIGIGDNDVLEVDGALAVNDIMQATAAGLQGLTYAQLKAVLNYIESVEGDTTPVLGGDLDANQKDIHDMKQVDFYETVDNGDSGATPTIDWNSGNQQQVKLTLNATFTFTAPAGPCGLTLYLIGNGAAKTTIFPSDCEFLDKAEPDVWGATTNEVVGIISLRYDPSLTPKYVMSGASLGVA